MASTTGASNSICPFFLREYNKSITCEGVGENDEMMHRFKSAKEKCRYQERYCFGFEYYRCPLARMLEEKYGK